MVVVKIELWPGGDQNEARLLGAMTIVNDGSGDAKKGNYVAALSHAGKYIGRKGPWKKGVLKNHNRHLSPYHLIKRCLEACGII